MRVTVVTDTSVILNLCLLRQQRILPLIFNEIHSPPSVKNEFLRLAATDPRFSSLVFPPYIRIQAPLFIHPLLVTPRLHAGECDALSLAVEINATRVLMDEKAGRAAAAQLGIPAIGLLGILIEAKRRNLVPHLSPLLDRLQSEARFWFSPALRHRILQLAGESP